MLTFNNYSKYYSQISLYFHLFLETNFYRYSFLTNFTILKKNRVLGYNLFSRVKGFAPYALKKNILKIKFDYLHSKTLNNKFISNKVLNFDYFNFWSDSYKKYQDNSLKDIFVSLNKKKKLKPLNISLDYTIMDKSINEYNLNNYIDIIYIHKYDLLYSLSFNLFYNVKHHFYSKIWLLNHYISLNSIYFNKFLGNLYWNFNYDFNYFDKFFDFLKIKLLINPLNFIKNYNFRKHLFLSKNIKSLRFYILKKKNRVSKIIYKIRKKKKKYRKLFFKYQNLKNKKLNWKFLNKKYHKFYPLKTYKRKKKNFRFFNKKYKQKCKLLKLNIKNSYKHIKLNILKFNKYLVKKVFSNKFNKSLSKLSIKIYKFYLKFINFKNNLRILFDLIKFKESEFISEFYNKTILKYNISINKYKIKILSMIQNFNKRINKYNKFITFIYSFIKTLNKEKKKKMLNFLPYFKNRKYIKKISNYFFFSFKYIYIYFKKYLNQKWFFKSKLFKYLAISLIKNLPQYISKNKFWSIIKNNKQSIISVISQIYKKLIPLKHKLKAWKIKKKYIIKKKFQNELNYKLYIKKRNYYHRIKNYKLSVRLTSKMNFLINKRSIARKTLYNNSLGLFKLLSFNNLQSLNYCKYTKPKLYYSYKNLKKRKRYKLLNLMKLKNEDDQDNVVLILLKKKKNTYYKHFEVLKYVAKSINMPFILEELIPPAILHSMDILKNIDKYTLSSLPTYRGTNTLKRGIISETDKKLFKSKLCDNIITRRIYYDVYKSKKSVYEHLGIDFILDNLKFVNPGKNLKLYIGMNESKNKKIPLFFDFPLNFNKKFYKNLEKVFNFPFSEKKEKTKKVNAVLNVPNLLKNWNNNKYFNKLLKQKEYNNYFFQTLKKKGYNKYFIKTLKEKLKNKKNIKLLTNTSPTIAKNLTEKFLSRGRPFYIKSKLDLKYWKLFGTIFNTLNHFKMLSRNIIYRNNNILNVTYLNLNKFYSIFFFFFIRIFYKFSKFLKKKKKIRKFKGFSFSIKKTYKRFTYKLKYIFVKKYKLIKKKKQQLIKNLLLCKNNLKKKYKHLFKVKTILNLSDINKQKVKKSKYKFNVKLILTKKKNLC